MGYSISSSAADAASGAITVLTPAAATSAPRKLTCWA
eukprot:CAMPEP_0178402182 /NCGR_PEP_ID=MMETSP0689_2-20121128/16702_1 /TAXON_ID=160604 /ORGANISM="Amphidinium massartii, Strain CS-259" /LENGTH=36 /DNA_ID= /DNA_START= /DNA_END= /DNA_ORIENTATION=